MKVRELIQLLQKSHPDKDVVISFDGKSLETHSVAHMAYTVFILALETPYEARKKLEESQ